MARQFQPRMATGSDLLEGDVVYFTSAGNWSRRIEDAALAVNPDAAANLLSRASAFPNAVVGVYLVEAALDDRGRAAPAHFREVFRTRGPSNYPQHGRQAEREHV
ncbi:MAG TPA: DUF2849 domain-containing protein [Amaricoccus sp.]|uniref:DUF2849 domain-containing protein n=1 Tax=Amaricoccus sp. TaxID=1872485 RepID=UPI001D37AE7A|nr:DUF2849 domain-containing protein [Amaricoccus sp.]MCB1371339.1 DUF2849 domain-containing protein [Paracoccaceae bacterium]MCB1374673.1 DUF2849 domain-containing protein [Paracoccaceae bacterium]MCB1403386.1 DUF2849 domain-containing protein [Paracoccaceae bacterium]HPG21957.1 DUF2849 domain-containing protein [Amaricoccus sp.]HRW13927.1 DUF2849 domain-containing protein [Amaricoccus sp.]